MSSFFCLFWSVFFPPSFSSSSLSFPTSSSSLPSATNFFVSPFFFSHLLLSPFLPSSRTRCLTKSTARGSRRSTAETRRGKKKRRKKKEKNEPFSFRPAFPIPAFFFVYKRSVNKKETHIVKDRERTATGEAAKRQGGGRRKREEAKAPLHLFFSLFLFGLLSSLVERSKNSSCDKEGTDPGKGCCVSLRRGKREREVKREREKKERASERARSRWMKKKKKKRKKKRSRGTRPAAKEV